MSDSRTAGGWASGEGEGGGNEPVDEAGLVGRRQSGVLLKEVGAESSAKLRFARNELRKAMRRLSLASDLVAKALNGVDTFSRFAQGGRGIMNSGRVLHRLGQTYLQMS